MKVRVSTSLFLAIILLITSTSSVFASPDSQDPQDAIREALNATAQELGMSQRAENISEAGVTGWALNPPFDPGQTTILVLNTDVFFQTMLELAGTIGGSATPQSFHGYTAYSIADMFFVHNVNGFYITTSDSSDTLGGAKRVAEVFYRHAVASGLTTGSAGTALPELTPTPEVGTQITVRAYAENYDQVVDFIDNSDNFGSVDISGRVTDAETGGAIQGAVIEIISGAASNSTLSTADGSYSLTAAVPGGEDSGGIQDFDFTLPLNAELSIEVTSSSSELAADGTSTAYITIQVKDTQGNPLKDRIVDLEVSADAGPGTIQPQQATTDENGLIQATYTSFKLDPGQTVSTSRHEVTISARDTASGLTGTNWIFVNQYQLSVQSDEYILACTQCSFPSVFTIFVTDYWNNPVPNTPLTLQVEGSSSGGSLALDPNSNISQQDLSLTTDGNGQATAYYIWQGSPDIEEAIQKVTVIEGVTNTQATKNVNVQGIDISLARVEEAGFTGVTGQQAFLKVYFKERLHPDLPLDRFNDSSPNKLGLRVTISQYHA
ncbi:MAG: Ig-like domain-containing protein, partial [Anaerolineales bacterium]